MKLLILISIMVLLSGLSSCSFVGLHTSSELQRNASKSYQRGVVDGRSAEVRRNLLAEQREKERPKAPPKTVYYDVPVQGHTSADGVKIAPHTVTIPIIQP